MNHFLDLAYNISNWSADPEQWLTSWAFREFDQTLAPKIANAAARYSNLAAYRKYELVQTDTYSLVNYDEADMILESWNELAYDMQAFKESLEPPAHPPLFELLLYPVLAGASVQQLNVFTAKNNLYARQGRSSANAYANLAISAFRNDREFTSQYHTFLHGKWNYIMSQPHIGYSYWQQPMRQSTPGLSYADIFQDGLQGPFGVSAEGGLGRVPGDDNYHQLGSNVLRLQTFGTWSPRRWIEIFATGTSDVYWSIKTSDPFVNVSQTSGHLKPDGSTDVRVYLNIDWSYRPPVGVNGVATITISSNNSDFSYPTVLLPYNYTSLPIQTIGAFAEMDGRISFDAWSYPQLAPPFQPFPPPDGSPFVPAIGKLLRLPHYGLTLFPFNTGALTYEKAPYLMFNFWSFAPGRNASLVLYFAPSLNTDPSHPLRYGYRLDQSAAVVRQVVDNRKFGQLPIGWDEAVIKDRWETRVDLGIIQPGDHIMQIALLDVGLVLKKVIIDFGGLGESAIGPPMSFWIGHYR
jgi:hypothetical protein